MKTKLMVIKLIAYLCYGFAALSLTVGLIALMRVRDFSSLDVSGGLYKLFSIAVTGLLLDVLSELGLNVLDVKEQLEEMIADSTAIAP